MLRIDFQMPFDDQIRKRKLIARKRSRLHLEEKLQRRRKRLKGERQSDIERKQRRNSELWSLNRYVRSKIINRLQAEQPIIKPPITPNRIYITPTSSYKALKCNKMQSKEQKGKKADKSSNNKNVRLDKKSINKYPKKEAESPWKR